MKISNGIYKNKGRSFTLIELLVVIAIIGLLASIVLVSLKGTREKAQRVKVLQFAAQVHHALGADAVGIWDFENNLNDSSGYGNNGTWENTGGLAPAENFKCAISDKNNTPSGQGCSLSFDGANDYVDCGARASLNITDAITITAWVKPNSAGQGGYGRVLRKQGTDWEVYMANAPHLYFAIVDVDGGTHGIRTDDNSVPYGQWSHVVFTFDGTKQRCYVNGTQGTYTASWAKKIRTSKQNLYIGNTETLNRTFDGLIDEVRIYEQDLTSAQIQKLYAEGLEKHQNLTMK